MKKFLLAIFAMLCVAGASAQDWSVGGRVGSGFQVVGQYKYDGSNYFEARFGTSWNNPVVYSIYENDTTIKAHQGRVMADFTILHNWHILDMDWTPRGGMWFFDAGVGVNVGGVAHYAYAGISGMARLGFTFNNTPITLALDWTPTFGAGVRYVKKYNEAFFNELGLANIGISCTYNF